MARLSILMATYNGERFLEKQLESFEDQSFKDWDLWVSDDGSKDATTKILQKFATSTARKVVVCDGPHEGFVKNFLSLAVNCRNESSYFAFSDQDDIWNKDKLQVAVDWLDTIPSDVPALYCSRTEVVDGNADSFSPQVFSPLMEMIPSFSHALVQSIAGGNTMVFNKAAKNLIEDFGGAISVPSHDWWLYILVSGVGGAVYYDPYPSLRYRQHGGNLIGSNRSVKALLIRLNKYLNGTFRKYNDSNIAYLRLKEHLLTDINRRVFENFVLAKDKVGPEALIYLRRSGVKRQGAIFNIALWLGALLGRI